MTKKLKKFLAILLAMSMTLGVLTIGASAAETRIYADVFVGDWYEDAVAYVTEKGYMNGVDVDLFAPLEGTTRAMVVTVLYRMETEPAEAETATFTDLDPVGGDWYMAAVNWATANQIARGYEDGTFRPSNIVTREELATFFYRWAQYKNYNVSLIADLSGYADNGDIQDYAKEAMAWTVAVGLIQGVTENTLCPVAYAKRAETAMILYRLTGDPKVVAAITSDEDLGENDTPLTGTPDLPYNPPVHTHSYTYGEWTPTEDGTQHTRTGTCSCGQTNVQTADHAYDDGVCVCGKLEAVVKTEGAKEALEAVLATIKGNDGKQLVTIEETETGYAATLDTDAIMGSGESFGDDLLNGLVTRLKAGLDSYFGEYTLTVNEKDVYVDGEFKNSELKAAIYDVAGGFFYTLANMEPAADGVYTYKTVDGKVTNTSNSQDAYGFDVAIQLKGADVEKVQKMASILEKHLSMTTMTAAEVKAEYGTDVTGENEFIVVGMEMPGAIMKSLKAELGITDEILAGATEEEKAQVLELIREKFDRQTVNALLGGMAETDITGIVGNGVDDVETLISMVNGNANLVNKVLGKLTISVTPNDGAAVQLVKKDVTFAPNGNDWEALVNAVLTMLDEGGNVTPGQFTTNDPDHYLVPITVKINLGETFQGTETVLFDLHIALSDLVKGPDTPVDPEVKTAQTVTDEAVTDLNTALAQINSHGDPVITVEGENGAYAATLNADAILGDGASFGDNVLDGLVTNLKAALDEKFGDYTLTVGGQKVYANKTFDNTALKNALFDVSSGFFYKLANMQPVNDVYTYKTVDAVVTSLTNANDTYPLTLAINLSGSDVEDKIIPMAAILEEHLGMPARMTEAQIKDIYGENVAAFSGEDEYIVVEMEMPGAIMKSLKAELGITDEILAGATEEEKTQALELIREKFDRQTVNALLGGMAETDITGIVGNGVDGVETLISMVNGNANLVNKVLGKLTISVTPNDGAAVQLVKKDVTFAPNGNDWEALVNAVLTMLDEGGNVTPGQFTTEVTDHYLVPITVKINLGETFQGTETVLFDLHIALSDLVK